MAGKRQDFLEGMQFKNWKVLEYIGRSRYKCKCLLCGYERDIVGTFLKDGEIPGCKGCEIQSAGGEDPKDLTGKTFGEWKVIKYVGKKKWLCECSCGVVKEVATYSLVHGDSKSCGHSKDSKFVDLTGKKFGEWTVLKQASPGKNGETRFLCRCSCGTERIITSYNLRNGYSKSCGHATTGFHDLTGKAFGELTVLYKAKNQTMAGQTVWTCRCSCGNIVDVGGWELRSQNTRSCGCKKEELKRQTNLERYGVPQVGMLASIKNRTPEQIAMTSSPENLVKAIRDNFDHKPGTYELAQLAGVTVATIRIYVMRHNLEEYVSIAQPINSSYELALESLFPGGIRHDRKVLEGKELDLFYQSAGVAIEFNGDYWHNELKLGKDYHRDKSLSAIRHKIRLIHIFEYEWLDKELNPKIIKHIKRVLGTEKLQSIGARNCEIRELTTVQAKEFLNKYHLQGFAVAEIHIGLIYNSEIVGVLSFGRPRFNSEFEYELIRLCWKDDLTVPGGAQKLFKYFVDKVNPSSIVSYCDISKFSGDIYEKLGFKLDEITSPNYKWVDLKKHNYLSRYKTQKQRLLDAGLGELGETEEEIMQNLGYVRIYDCGNARYVWQREIPITELL